MRIATYNIAAGQFCNQQLEILRDQIKSYQIDIVGLQEVDELTQRSGGVEQIEALKWEKEDFAKFDRAIEFDGGSYGLGMICKLPVEACSYESLDSRHYEQRIIQKFTIRIGEVEGSFYNTHLSFEDKATRQNQMKYLKNLLDKDLAAFKIVTGDFNIESTEEWDLFKEEYLLVNGYKGVWHDTFPGDDCMTHKLDQIILSKQFDIQQVGIVEKPYSDHYMMWVEVSVTNDRPEEEKVYHSCTRNHTI